MAYRYSISETPPPAVHGGADGEGSFRLDFSVNTNPFGPPTELLAALQAARPDTYPDRHLTAIKKAGAAALQCAPDNVLFGAGTAEIIYRLSAALLSAGDDVVVGTPTFHEFARSARLRGAHVHEVPTYAPATDENRNLPDVTALVEALRRIRPVLCWICHPNNPTGHAWSDDQLALLADVCDETSTQLCIDAAYVHTAPGLTRDFAREALLLRSPTKVYGIPGVRLGIATGPASLIALLESFAPPWVIGNAEIAAAAWIFSPAAEEFLAASIPPWMASRDELMAALGDAGCEVFSSSAPYFMIRHPHVEPLVAQARMNGIRLRSLGDFGMTDSIRMAARTPAEHDAFLAWFKEGMWKSG